MQHHARIVTLPTFGRLAGGRFALYKRDFLTLRTHTEDRPHPHRRPRRASAPTSKTAVAQALAQHPLRAAAASCLQLDALPPRHPLIHRSGFARDRPGLGRAVTCNSASAMLLSNHSQRPAAGSIPAQADARRGLLHERALVHHQGLEEVRRACCHCILLP